MTPEQGLRHPWIRRNKAQSLLKENENMTKMFFMRDLQSVMQPLPATRKQR